MASPNSVQARISGNNSILCALGRYCVHVRWGLRLCERESGGEIAKRIPGSVEIAPSDKRMSDFRHVGLSVFFPAYNDAQALPELLERTFQVVSRLTPNYEVLIVNDGSTDGTASV